MHYGKLHWSANHRIVYLVLSVPYNTTSMEQKVFDNVALGQYISKNEANAAEAQVIRRIDIKTDDYDNFKRLKATNCGLELVGIMLDVREGTEFDDSLRSTLEWLLACMASKVQVFTLAVCTPTKAFLDLMLPLLDKAALDLSESNNTLHVFDDSDISIEEAVYRRSTKLLDYFPSLAVVFRWAWPIRDLNSTNTILVKAALQSKNVKSLRLHELNLEAGDQLGKVIGEEVDQVHLTELVFTKTHFSLGRFPHEIVEKSKNLTQLIIEYHPYNQIHEIMGLPYIAVCESGYEAFRKLLESGKTIRNLQLRNITNLKTNDGFSIADCMPNLEILVIKNNPNKPFDHPYPNLDLTLTDMASLCGPSLRQVVLQVGALALVSNQPIDQYVNAALIEFQAKCPHLEALHIQSHQPYTDIAHRYDAVIRRSLVEDNHSSTVHDQIVAQADSCKFTPAKLNALTVSFTVDKGDQVNARRIFKWEKSKGFARLIDLEYDLQKPSDFKRKIVHLPIGLEELYGVPDLMGGGWADTIESLPRAEN